MRVVIDMQGAQTESRFRGIGGYTKSLVRSLLLEGGGYEYILVMNGRFPESIDALRNEFHGLISPQNIKIWYPCVDIRGAVSDGHWRRNASTLIFKLFIKSLKPDLFFITSYFEGFIDDAVTFIDAGDAEFPCIVSLFDLIPLADPPNYLDKNRLYGRFYRGQLNEFKEADAFLSISEYSSDQAVRLLNINKNKIHTIGAAMSDSLRSLPCFSEEFEGDFKKIKIDNPFILAVGGGDSRKNLKRLISAYLRLAPHLLERFDLVLAGPGIDAKTVKKNLPKNRVNKIHILGYVSDGLMRELYKRCSLFVFPSLMEGFGLPPLEAMYFGAPVISSNVSSLPEIVGDSDRLFNPYDEGEITSKIEQVLNDAEFAKILSQNGKERALKFCWSDVARRSIEVFNALIIDRTQRSNERILNNEIEIFLKSAANVQADKSVIASSDLMECSRSIIKTFPHTDGEKKKIYLDISELVKRDARTGVQRVTRSILLSMIESPPDDYDVCPVYADIDSIGYKHARKYVESIKGGDVDIIEDILIEPCAEDIFLGLDLQHHTTRVQANYLRELMQYGVSVYFVVYDLLPIQFPECWPREHSVDLVHRDWLRVVCESHGAICISESVKSELEDWVSKSEITCKRRFGIKSFYLGCDIKNNLSTFGLNISDRDDLKKFNNAINFLMVGTVEPRKGHLEAIQAFEKIWLDTEDKINLVIVGKEGWLSDEAINAIKNSHEYGKRLYWYSHATDELLDELYKISSCLLCTSKGEGFGLPLIEAAQNHLPIIARDIPVFKEVANNGAYFFQSDETLHIELIRWVKLFKHDSHPKSDKIKTISWATSAKELWRAIQELEFYAQKPSNKEDIL